MKRLLILAGGGGHTASAQILGEEMHGRAELMFLVPEDDPLSLRRLETYGSVGTLLKPRHPTTPFWRFMVRLAKAFYQSLSRVPEDLDAVVSTGHNFSIPPSLMAWMRGVPLVNLETRVRFTGPSRTASILQRFAEITALQWEEQGKHLDGTVFGPVLPKRKIEPWNGGYILVTAGTYGYRELFDAISESTLENVVLQTGLLDGAQYEEKHPEWKVISFTDEFEELLAGADAVICPPGGTPIEAVVYGKPVVIVRYPDWTRASGIEDTEAFAKKLRAPLIKDITPMELEAAIEEARESERPVLRDGTGPLADAILSL